MRLCGDGRPERRVIEGWRRDGAGCEGFREEQLQGQGGAVAALSSTMVAVQQQRLAGAESGLSEEMDGLRQEVVVGFTTSITSSLESSRETRAFSSVIVLMFLSSPAVEFGLEVASCSTLPSRPADSFACEGVDEEDDEKECFLA